MTRIYFAGKFSNKEKIQEIQDYFINESKNEVEISYDWTRVEETADSILEKKDKLREYAENDLKGIEMADFVVVLLDDVKYPYRGTWVEIGYALGLKKHIICIYNKNSVVSNENLIYSNIFFHMPDIQKNLVHTKEEAYEKMKQLI